MRVSFLRDSDGISSIVHVVIQLPAKIACVRLETSHAWTNPRIGSFVGILSFVRMQQTINLLPKLAETSPVFSTSWRRMRTDISTKPQKDINFTFRGTKPKQNDALNPNLMLKI